jgi:DNA-binding winged helix-turn-helix (wHTH) protein
MTSPVLNAGGFEMTANESARDMRSSPTDATDGPGGRFSWFLRAPFRREPWLAAAYLLVQFPIGVAAFVYAVTMVSVGAGTIVLALVGAALLILFMYSLQPYGEMQRYLSNALLGTRIAPLPFRGESGALWSLDRLKTRASNPMTWRLAAYIFLQFALAVAGFVVVTALLSLPIGFLLAPLAEVTGGEILFADSWEEGAWLVPLSVPMFFISVALIWGAGWVAGRINTLFLGTQYAGISDEGPTVLERAKAAVGAWSNPGAPVVLDEGTDVGPAPSAVVSTAAGASQADEGLMVDVAMRRVRVNGHAVELTPKEFDLLALFAQNPGRPFSRDDLLDRIWKNDYEVTDRTIDTHVQRLRKKLGNQSGVIQTVWGVGYRFEDARAGEFAVSASEAAPAGEGPAERQRW